MTSVSIAMQVTKYPEKVRLGVMGICLGGFLLRSRKALSEYVLLIAGLGNVVFMTNVS